MFTLEMIALMGEGLLETLYMTLLSAALSYVLGLPLGVILVLTDPDGIHPNAPVNRVLGTVVNALRSVPFPVTRFITGTTIGPTATIVPLTIAAAPFIARMVEGSLKEVDRGVIEASLSMGASPLQVVWRVLLPEALPSLINGAAIATTTLLGYSAMAGICGGGGLGAIAINYGYYRGETDVMLVMVVILILVVQLFQFVGERVMRRVDKRIR